MTKRQKIICSHIPAVEVLADVGCDHGYMTEYALKNGLCKRAYLTDVSAESLKKAETLLQKEIAEGRCFAVCCDGMKGLPALPDCAVIAGMGGEEILHVLQESGIPSQFVLQPMKNAEKVRAFLVERGCEIFADYTFEDGKWYDIIVGKNEGGSQYGEWELLFGRDNLKNPSPAFYRRTKKERSDVYKRLKNPALSQKSREKLLEKLRRLEVIVNAVEEDC